MLTELSVVEQRYLAVREVLDGAKVIDVATRYGVDASRDEIGVAALDGPPAWAPEDLHAGERWQIAHRPRQQEPR